MKIKVAHLLAIVLLGVVYLTSGKAYAQTPGPSLNADVLFSMVNSYRQSIKLPPFQKNDLICTVAAKRAPEVYGEIYVSGPMHKGFWNMDLPYWATENIIFMRNEQEALNWWLNSPIHRSQIQGEYTYSCIACQGQACSQVFTSFIPKQTEVVTNSTITPR